MLCSGDNSVYAMSKGKTPMTLAATIDTSARTASRAADPGGRDMTSDRTWEGPGHWLTWGPRGAPWGHPTPVG